MLKIRSDVIPSREQLFALYSDVGWTAYTRDMDCLERAVAASLAVFTTWEGDRLVGLLRCVGDGETSRTSWCWRRTSAGGWGGG